MRLFNSERFQKEYKDFKSKISQIDNERVKKELSALLDRLVEQVKAIDRKHEDLTQQTRLPNTIDDVRNELFETRKKITTKLSDWEKAISR